MKRFTLSITGCLLLGLFLAACAPARPRQTLVFEHRTAVNRELYSVYPDGSHLALMAELPVAGPYAVSGQGDLVAYLGWPPQQVGQPLAAGMLTITAAYSGSVIDRIENAGETRFEEISSAENLAWSPRGDALAFLRNSTGSSGINVWVYQLATHRSIQLTQDDSALRRALQWSPDGKLLAFTAEISSPLGDTAQSVQTNYWDITVVSPDGSYRKTITDMRSARLPVMSKNPFPYHDLCHLRWSPDGKFIAFENQCGWGPPDYKEIYLARLDVPTTLQLTNLSSASGAADNISVAYSVRWSNSGNRLFVGYTQYPFGPPEPNQTFESGLVVFQASDFSTATLVDSLGVGAEIGADEQSIIWHSSDTNGPSATFLGKLVDRQLVPITFPAPLPDNACSTSPFQWSPDGQYVAYTMAEQNGILDKCAEDRNRGIAVVSWRDGKVMNVAAMLGGSNRLVGWLSTALTQP